MDNLRILNVRINSSTSITLYFTHNVTNNLSLLNFDIESITNSVPSSKPISYKVINDQLTINCLPLTSLAVYNVVLKSTSTNPFISLNGDAKIIEDGISNKIKFIGPIESDNPIKSYLLSYLNENIYDVEDNTTLVSKYIQSLSKDLYKAINDIRQVKNENYLSFVVKDEKKIRGNGPFDRLDEEGAYEVIRVAKTQTGFNVDKTISIVNFPSYPITLQKESTTDFLKIETSNIDGHFNINDLILNLLRKNVTKLISLTFTLNTVNPVYEYNIEKLGYQILNSRYDQNYASNYDLLKDNQIKISNEILKDNLFDLTKIIKVEVKYEYKNLGKIIDANSLDIYSKESVYREVLPPIINIFNLKNAPIVDINGEIANIGGLVFVNPDNLQNTNHPAFINEISFKTSGLPYAPGQYSVDYETGTVYVYGEDEKNDGTGPYPPLVNYNFKLKFKYDQDYSYDAQSYDLVALPLGSLINYNCNIKFNYEEVLIPNIDYKCNLHQEALGERINNNITFSNIIITKNSPITNVFRVYNETTGEIYSVTRWSDNKIYIRGNNLPNIKNINYERVNFNNIINEILFINSSSINSSNLRIFKILLKNNNIVSSTEDCIGSSFNSSVSFSNQNIFKKEIWYHRYEDLSVNIDKLTNIGDYLIDYINGIIYCAVSNYQDNDIGFVNYKNNKILLNYPHIINVSDIYYQINYLSNKNKSFSFISFEDKYVVPELIDYSDESYISEYLPYQINNSYVGVFLETGFLKGVKNEIKFIRNIYEFNDLNYNKNPLNFSSVSTSNGFDVKVNEVTGTIYSNILNDGYGFYVFIDKDFSYISQNLDFNISVLRISDSSQLWDSSGVIEPGSPVKLILSGINNPNIGDFVKIDYSIKIKDLSRIIIDYNKGDFFIDYEVISDEIIIDYEFGDNNLDFRESISVAKNTEYYVTYKAGALRDSLLKNFGNLINLQDLNNFNLDFNRERYRETLIAALTSFINGPTITAIKNIAKNISHIDPQVVESVFQNWSLGSSLLNSQLIKSSNDLNIVPAKYNNGVLINSDNTITFPASSNIRLDEGTFETWISPNWNGLDNNSNLIIQIYDTNNIIESSKVFIGANGNHPEIKDNKIFLNKKDILIGQPNFNRDGVFIYYDKDLSNLYYRWFLKVIDGYTSTISNYKFIIETDGSFYDSKFLDEQSKLNSNIFTGINKIQLNINDPNSFEKTITFFADKDHYLFDVGSQDKNRISLYKDPSGYLNFKIIDKNSNTYLVSSDVSSWKEFEFHHVAVSWKINNKTNRDEIHLFLDGLEVPNIIRYNDKLKNYFHEKFRTVNPEEIISLVDRDILSSIDLKTIQNDDVVSSSINFSNYNIFVGDKILINEIGFDPNGYTILNINGQFLQLDQQMPFSINNAKYTINKSSFLVKSNIDIVPNISVSTVSPIVTENDLVINLGSNIVSSNIDFNLFNIKAGDLLKIHNINFDDIYTVVAVSSNSLTLSEIFNVSISNCEFSVYSISQEKEIPGINAARPSYEVYRDANGNKYLTLLNNVYKKDLILIRTLGVNYNLVKQKSYIWSDNIENILMTKLPTPINLDDVIIRKIILQNTIINSNNSTINGNLFTSNNLYCDNVINSQNGRTLSVSINGNNIDFSSPLYVTINGIVGFNVINEIIEFNSYSIKDSVNKFTKVNFINVNGKLINTLKSILTIECKEKYKITQSEDNVIVPVIKYSYLINSGSKLKYYSDNCVIDESNNFNLQEIGSSLIITSPQNVAGYYIIEDVLNNGKVLKLKSTNASNLLPLNNFSDGIYSILKTNEYRSGLQNGFFTFELDKLSGQAFFLSKGFYEIEYYSYFQIKMDPLDGNCFIGTDINGKNNINAIIDQIKIYSIMLKDNRVGEIIPQNQKSITKDFNSLKSLEADPFTLMLINFDNNIAYNNSYYYINKSFDKRYFKSTNVINENFNNSIILLENPLILSNNGILDLKNEGTIEFWINPLFDTANDPNERYYFDAYSVLNEEYLSDNNVSIKLNKPVSKVLSIKVKGDDKTEYFIGGQLEIDSDNSIQETVNSISNISCKVSKNILQVIKVEILGDLSKQDYFYGGSISKDGKTIYLGKSLPLSNIQLVVIYKSTENKNILTNNQIIRLNKKLPNQNTEVIVKYIPEGMQGDRLSIFKDKFSNINFKIVASGKEFTVQAPIVWSKDTWHRIKASYKVNALNNSEIRIFIDGQHYFKKYDIISFKDKINNLYVGSDYNEEKSIYSIIDNLRISNISRQIYAPYGYPIDINYNLNLNVVMPATEDLYTTYLINFDLIKILNTDFITIKNKYNGLFDFYIKIFDSFDILKENNKSKEILEKLIKILKPANSRAFIQYIA